MKERSFVLEFTKMNGAGNDFIVVDNRFYHFTDAELSAFARTLCPRRTSVGADGLLAFMKPDDPAHHHYRMRYYNADGSLATMCGNGARCLARFAYEAGLTALPLVFESDAGVYKADVPAHADAPVRLYVQPPADFRPHLSPPAPEEDPVHYIWTGTEHLVRFVDDVEAAPVAYIGPLLRQDARLSPRGANVNFVQVVRPGSPDEPALVYVRTFEKGVEAETLACGTGALASGIVAHLLDRVASEVVDVRMPGGMLRVGFNRDGALVSNLFLEGPVATVFRGTVDVELPVAT